MLPNMGYGGFIGFSIQGWVLSSSRYSKMERHPLRNVDSVILKIGPNPKP